MAAVIIRKKDVEKLGKELIKEVYDFLHNDYIVSTFEEMEKTKIHFLKTVVHQRCRYFKTPATSYDEELKLAIEEIKDGKMDISLIFDILLDLDLDQEIDEDLYCKHISFLDIYRVFENSYTYLE